MPTVFCGFRTSPFYPRVEFLDGLRRHGYKVVDQRPRHIQPDDLLLLWNRNRIFERVAAEYEAAGARILISENGYLDRAVDGKTKYYALALAQHNGCGAWYVGDAPRFEVSELPWRKRGSHVLVLPQRGIGSPSVRMPSQWTQTVAAKLKRMTDRPIVIRPHPGHTKSGARDTLDAALHNCHAVVTWGSGGGIKALRAGVPVFHELERWIGACAASRLADNIEAVHMPDRTELWRRVTWGQWTLAELSSGEAYEGLLHVKDRDLLRQ